MAVTKILARNAHLDQAIQYVLNGEKTEGRVLTAHQNCDPGHEYQQMMDTKRELGKTGGRQCYHIIQSFKPGEITPELALELAKGFFPVHIALHVLSPTDPLFALVLAAPVIGHAFPLFHPRMGGKAIAVSFGCLLGLYPDLRPVLTLAAFYLIFSLLLVIDPHLFRSMITYLCFCLNVLRTVPLAPIRYGTILISIVVILRHAVRYEKEPLQIRLLKRNR